MRITATIWNFVVRATGWRFKVDREGSWTFKVTPSTYWILKDGYWDNDGIWVNHEIWRIP